ncbi:MAG: HisA/HisF-related TIM barrel protein [Thermoproteota archaeon]
MMVVPAIDVMGSKRVEVVSHIVEKKFEADPSEIAVSWEKAGARMIHLVDIDAALNTGRSNRDVIKRAISSVKIPVQVAGGIRSRSQAEELLSAGASRIVVRPRPCSTDVAKDFQGLDNIVLGIDYLEKNVLRDVGRSGVRVSEQEAASWVSRLDDSIGLRGVLVTDVGTEGSMSGLRGDTISFLSLLMETGLEMMYAGGISCLEDVSTLRGLGLSGIVVGKALYNGVLSFNDLRRVAEG